MNALRLIHAARQGDGERRTMIKSGAVVVFGFEESGIKRWTVFLDDLLWLPSRIVGKFVMSTKLHGYRDLRKSGAELVPKADIV
ncbi:hypothetical protein DFH09DRAFT_1343052 [Mycena vulgaris]|nr:hypothetical protein DFH09DRAFT_1343052 [Mycena vulgaris]